MWNNGEFGAKVGEVVLGFLAAVCAQVTPSPLPAASKQQSHLPFILATLHFYNKQIMAIIILNPIMVIPLSGNE